MPLSLDSPPVVGGVGRGLGLRRGPVRRGAGLRPGFGGALAGLGCGFLDQRHWGLGWCLRRPNGWEDLGAAKDRDAASRMPLGNPAHPAIHSI